MSGPSEVVVGDTRVTELEEAAQKRRYARKLEETASGMVKAFAIRLEAGNDMMKEMKSVAAAIMAMCSPAVFILSCTGNLSKATLELGKAEDIDRKMKHEKKEGPEKIGNYEQPVQIVSLQGNFSQVFDPTAASPLTRKIFTNLTIFVSDAEGRSVSGKLINGTVLNSVELVFGCIQGVAFVREVERRTGEPELGVWVLEGGSDDEEEETEVEEVTEGDGGDDKKAAAAPKPVPKKKMMKKKKAAVPPKTTTKKATAKTTTKKGAGDKLKSPKPPASKPKMVAKKKKVASS